MRFTQQNLNTITPLPPFSKKEQNSKYFRKASRYFWAIVSQFKKKSPLNLFQGDFWIDYRSIWCRDLTIICITKKLEVKMPAYTSFISDVHKSYRVEKIVLHYLIFYLSRLVSVYWLQTQFYHNCKYLRLSYGKGMWNKIAFETN